MKHRFAVLLTLVVLLSSVLAGTMGGKASAVAETAPTTQSQFLSDFTEALNVIQKNYIDPIGSDKLVYGSIRGMLRALDPHSSFFDPKDFSRLREEQHSKYFGLGIRVRPLLRDRGRVVIYEPPAVGSPAERRGLRAGDVITKIEGQSIDDWTSDEVVSHLRGPRGTKVNITVERPNIREPLQFRIERDEIPLITVPYAFEIKPGVGYIRIDRFSESTADELREKLKMLTGQKKPGAEGQGISDLILDLRDNPGGLLNQAIVVADLFVPKNSVIVSTRGRSQDSARPYKAPSLEKLRLPVVVLINRHSASASEIVAGALQDHDRGLIVGETSFGKGLVQSVFTLESGTGMALTTARYYTPSGRLIQRPYTSSNFEYYNLADAAPAVERDEKEREIRSTDSGRKVMGGGGITPDIAVPIRELSRLEALLSAKDIFFEYARRLTSGQVPAASSFQVPARTEEVASDQGRASRARPRLEITDAILEDFKLFLKGKTIEYTAEEFAASLDFIKRRITQEVYTSAFGLAEGFKVAIQGDNQVQKALELLPEARTLMTTGRTSAVARNPEGKK